MTAVRRSSALLVGLSRWGIVRELRSAEPVVRLLVLTQLAFNVGFFMVLPYLSVHLADDLGLAAAAVGLALGIRTFSQQGLFVVGGTLADRYGVKRVVLAGCALRVAGFLGLAVADSAVAVFAATALTGFAAALFSPAVESALAREAGELETAGGTSRVDAFALFSVGGQIGAFSGPLVGTLLLLVDFRAACLAAAAVFVLILLAHARWLPARPAAHAGERLLAGWREVLSNRTFLLFAVAYSSQLVAYNQLYLLLPLEVERAWGSQAPLGWLFAASSLLVVAAQLPVTAWCRRLRVEQVLPAGFVGMSLAFVVVGLTAPAGAVGGAGLLPAVVFVVLLTVGEMVAMPFARDLVPRLAAERRLGTYFGVLSSLSGVAVLLASTAIGALVQAAPGDGLGAAAPWLVAGALPLVSAVVLTRLLPGLRAARR
ncbi:MFS transporter [Motilibacter deserti]|uniref:MFS transporter n=1 Tax=Motilibacter deserti TaxID=2714956 RepID=UPI002F2B2873